MCRRTAAPLSRSLLPLAALLLAAPAGAIALQQPEWRQASDHDVYLKPYAYEPRTIRLEADRPVRLRFVNSGQTTLSFGAPEFFRAARVRSRDDALLGDGSLRLAAGERRTIALVPARGRYRIRSSNLFHRLLGMTGEIIVE